MPTNKRVTRNNNGHDCHDGFLSRCHYFYHYAAITPLSQRLCFATPSALPFDYDAIIYAMMPLPLIP